MAKSTLPVIWSTWIDSTLNYRKMRFPDSGDPKLDLAVSNTLRAGLGPLPKDQVPPYIHFIYRDLKSSYKDNSPDFFFIGDGLNIVSERFHDFLVTFDLGATEFYEIPLYEYDQKTPRPGRWFIINIIEKKPTLVPEKSTWITETGAKGIYRPDGGGRDVLAVRANSAEGADLWQDPAISYRLFLTDRLKRAIKESGMKIRHMPMRKCVVVE